jgi:chemotaxis protein methyltransferase CheR
LHLRWRGFRKVRRQVYKRLASRMQELGLTSLEAYRAYLTGHQSEWAMLDTLCWIPISRFYRDQGVFRYMEHDVLPQLAELALARGEAEMRCWSAGCAGGEEPYTVAIIWRQRLATQFPTLRLRIFATDIDPGALQRAERGCYRASSVKDLPAEWRTGAFVESASELCLKDEYRASVTFMLQDMREHTPEGLFHLILCRNLAFTYFDETLQKRMIQRLSDRLAQGGALIIGNLESLPDGAWGIQPWSPRLGLYRKALQT